MKHIQHIKKGFTRILCVLLMTLGFVAFASNARAVDPVGLHLEFSASKDGPAMTSFEEGQKVYIQVKTSDGAYWTSPQTFTLKAPASFETRDSVQIIFPAQFTKLQTPIEYIMPFAVGEQGARVDSYVIDVGEKNITTSPVAITLKDAKDLVKVNFKPIKDSYLEGETIQLLPEMIFANGSPFDFSSGNKDVQSRTFLAIPYVYESTLNPGKTESGSITLDYDNSYSTVDIQTLKTLGTQGEVIFSVKSVLNPNVDSNAFLGLVNGNTAKVTLFDNVNTPITAQLSIDKTTYKALDEVIVRVDIGATNNGASAVTLKLEASQMDIFANSLTGKRLDTAFEVSIPVNQSFGTTRLRITPEVATGSYTITLLKDKDITIESGHGIASLQITAMDPAEYAENNYMLRMTVDSASTTQAIQMIQGETAYLYITSTFKNFRMGILEHFTFSWTVVGEDPLPIIGAINNECPIVRGDAQTLISITPQPALSNKSFRYNPVAQTQGKTQVVTNGIEVEVVGRVDRLMALDGVDSIEYGKTISLRGYLADTEMKPIQTDAEIEFQLHINPVYIDRIEGGSSIFDSTGLSTAIYKIPAQEQFSDPIEFKIVAAANEYVLPIIFEVTPISNLIKKNQAKRIDIYDNVTLTLETFEINGLSAYADHELPEGAGVKLKLKLSKPTVKPMTVIVKYSPKELLSSDGASVTIAAGSDEAFYEPQVYTDNGFNGKRQLHITFDPTRPILGLNKINPSVFYVIDAGVLIEPTITESLMEGDSVQVKLSLGQSNNSGDSLPVVLKLTASSDPQDNQKQLYRENLQDSYTFYILSGKDSVTGSIPTTKRLLNDVRQISWSIDFLKNLPKEGNIAITNDPTYKMDIRFEPIMKSATGVPEGGTAYLRATLTPSNNSNDDVQVRLEGRNELNDLGYPDFVDSAVVLFKPDSKYVDFELTTHNLNQLFTERFGSVIVGEYQFPRDHATGTPLKDYFNSVDSAKTKITAVYASPTFRFYSVEIEGNTMASADPALQVPAINTEISVEEPERLKTKQVTLRAEQIAGTLSKRPITVRIKRDGETTIKNINYKFTSEDQFVFDSFEKNASGQPDTPKAKGDLMPIITLDLLNDASNDVAHKTMKFALDQGVGNNLEDSSALVTIVITPRGDFNPTIEGVGFSPRQPVYIPVSGSGFFSIFATKKPRVSFVDIKASGLKYGSEFVLFTVTQTGAETPLLDIVGKPNTFKIEIPANTSWLTLKVKPMPDAVKLNKEKKLTLRMSNPLYTSINSRYASDAITIYSDNPKANVDVLVIPNEEKNGEVSEYYLNCLQNDRSYKWEITDYLNGATVSSVTKPIYGKADVFVEGHNNVRYFDMNQGVQLFDQFKYTLSEYGQGSSFANIYVYKGDLIATAGTGSIPLSPTYFNTAKPKFQGFYFDSIADPQNKNEKKLSIAFDNAFSDSITFTLKGKIKLYSSQAVAGSVKSNQFLASIIDDPAVQLPRIGFRITSNNINNPDSVIGVAIVTAPILSPLTEIVQLKKNKFAIKIDGKYLSNKPTFYFEYFADNNKMKRQKLKILKVLDREAQSPLDVVTLQEKGTFFVEAPYFITSLADTRIDFVAFNQSGYACLNNTKIYEIAKEQKASYVAPIVNDEKDFTCVLNNKNEMIVGIVSTSSGDDKSISFSLTYVDLYNVEKTIKLPLQNSYTDKSGNKHDLRPARQNSVFYVKIPHLLLSPEAPLVSITCRNSIGRSTRSGINWLNFVNLKYPALQTPRLSDKIPTTDMFKTEQGNLVLKCTGEYLTKPTFYGRYEDKKGKIKLIKFKIVTSFYDDNGKYYSVEGEQTPVNGFSNFYIELKDMTPFRDAKHGDIVVTTTSSALSKDFYTNAEIKLDPDN